MIHYTCDRCKRAIDPETETRYVVEIDVRMVSVNPAKEEQVEGLDQLAELHEQLQRELKSESIGVGMSLENTLDELDDAVYCRDLDEGADQYDLCQQCHEAFVNNPLGREAAVGYGFSNN